ncbi:MAG: hypothetical protein HY516_00455 [Candidatus Aenigmarchaeota archaeon]|nr:hypothetical protein [Candidatus Aenigmarchaeota archaeon]
MTRPKIYGLGEKHPAGTLSLAAREIGQLLEDFGDTMRIVPQLKDAVRRYKGAENKIFRLRPYPGLYSCGEDDAWAGFTSAIIGLPMPDDMKKRSLERVENARTALLAEKQAVNNLAPEILYVEGVKRAYFGIVGSAVHAAEERGTKLVYLDERSESYRVLINESGNRGREFEESTKFKELQKKREDKWKIRVKRNLPSGTTLMIAGRSHLTRDNPDYPFIGRVPEMMEELGLGFELLAN